MDRYLRQFHLDQGRLHRELPAIRFQAEYSNDCWQFDMSPSDLKHIEKPDWIDPTKGQPTLMLFSVVDDRSGVNYQEYRCVYGEDVRLVPASVTVDVPKQPFDRRVVDYQFPNAIAAKLAIADDLARPLAKLSAADRAFIDQVLAESLTRNIVLPRVRSYFRGKPSGADHAG